jgi:Tfp pilus assembly protein PilF
MYFNWRKIIKRLIITGVLFGFCLNLNIAQTTRPPAKTDSIQQLLTEAATAFSSGDLIRAKTLVQKVLTLAPRDAAGHSLAGVLADRENDLQTAEKHFSTAVRLQPKSPEMHNNYGAILLRLDRKIEAAREFTASLAINPNQPSALVNLAQIRFTENNFQAARQLFEKAKAISPDAEIARALLVISLHLKDAAVKQGFQEYFDLSKDATNPAARRELASLLLENGFTDEAIRELEAGAALDSSKLDSLILLSRAYLQKKDVRSAGRLLESAVARGIDDAKIYAALAEVYKAGGYMENAIPAMRRAIEKEPGNEFLRAQYGLLLIDTRAPAAAIIRLKEAVVEFPNSARLWLALGIAQQIDGKMTDAQSSFEKSLQIEPNSIPALAYLATSFLERAEYLQAVKVYERAVALEEKNAVLHYLLADTLLKIPESDARRVEKHLTRAVQLDPKLSSAHLALGKLYARAENWQRALAEFEQAAQFAPESAEAHYQLGRTLARLKRADESRVAFEKFKKLNETQTAQKENDRQELVRRLANVRF